MGPDYSDDPGMPNPFGDDSSDLAASAAGCLLTIMVLAALAASC